MKLLREKKPTNETLAAVAGCVAHRCSIHADIPPTNMNEGNGSSECAICSAESFGTALAEQALLVHAEDVTYPLLEGYADRLTHHAMLADKLREVRDRLMLANLGYRDIDDVLMGGPK